MKFRASTPATMAVWFVLGLILSSLIAMSAGTGTAVVFLMAWLSSLAAFVISIAIIGTPSA